jgi:hypothetical protein
MIGISNSAAVTAPVFTCSICGEPSANICAYCTKDACANHRCERCKRCSDCCECDVPLSAEEAVAAPEASPELIVEEPAVEAAQVAEPAEPVTERAIPVFLTPEEASVFDLTEPEPDDPERRE